MADQPFGQLGVNGPDVGACVRQALETLQQRPDRDPETGQYITGNVGAGDTLERSAAFWAVVADVKAHLVARVRADQGGDSEAAETMLGLQDAYAEVRLFRQAMGVRLAELGGPVTTKGKARALYTSYLGALDRETKLAQVLGLERRARPVADIARQQSGLERQ